MVSTITPARLITLLCLALTLPAFEAGAQQFQATHGGVFVEDGRGGVQPLANGNGYISVGYTDTYGAPDIYVVQTDLTGAVVWAKRYDFGSNDYGRDIQECANGDFVITGTMHSGGGEDLFIMRIDAVGNHLWTTKYATVNNEGGEDVLEAANGDIVAAGWAYTSGGTNTRDGLVVRVSSAGANVWTRRYAPVGGGNIDYFMGLWEASNGDLLACGATQSFGSAAQGWLVRLTSAGAVGWSRHVGGGNNEIFNSVVELTVAPNTGNIAVAGATGGDYYVGKFSSGGILLANYAGGVTGAIDEMFQVRENQLLNPGNLLLTGYTSPGPIGGEDGYAVEMPPTLPCTGGTSGRTWAYTYGESSNDRLYSGHEVGNSCFDGYILCGQITQVMPVIFPFSTVQRYLVKTDVSGSSGCNELVPTEACNTPAFTAVNAIISATVIPALTTGTPSTNDAPGEAVLCFTACPPRKPSLGGAHDASAELANAWPNPIAAGASFHISYVLGEGTDVRVMVSDVNGRIVLERTAASKEGAGTLSIDTRGWPAGLYLVKVDLGSETQTQRIVVTAR